MSPFRFKLLFCVLTFLTAVVRAYNGSADKVLAFTDY